MIIQQVMNAMVAMMIAKFVLNDVPHAAGLRSNDRDYTQLSQDLEESVRQQIAWKSTPYAGDIWGQLGESTWARQEWGKIINGHVTLFHGTSEHALPSVLKEGIKQSYWTPPEELEEGEEPQKGVWLTTTPYYAFFYGDIALRVRIPATWIDRVMGDEIWLDRDVPPEMIVEHKAIEEWRRNLPSPNPAGRKQTIWIAIGPYSWGGSYKEQAAKESYRVKSVSEAIELAKKDPYFATYYDKIRAKGYKKMSFS